MPPNPNLSASQIAAQAAMQQQVQHLRQRSQTLPYETHPNGQRKVSRGPTSPPILSLTEASGERQSGFGSVSGPSGFVYRNGLPEGPTSAATTAANVVFHRSPTASPSLPPAEYSSAGSRGAEKPAKAEKSSKMKLFSKPSKISTKDAKDKPLPSPSKLGSITRLADRHAMSTTSLVDSNMSGSSSMYSMTNSSSATIRPLVDPQEKEKEKEKEKKHHFLSRQKHKLSGKDDHHLPLSSASSNSRPTDPNAPSSLYSFSLPPSPGQATGAFAKTIGRGLKEKKKEDKGSDHPKTSLDIAHVSDWFSGPSSLGSAAGPSFWGPPGSSHGLETYGIDPLELARYGLNGMTADDAWPFLKAKLLVVFEGEDLRLPIEDFNRLVSTHLTRCIQKRAPNIIIEDIRDLLTTGFSSLDQVLRRAPEDAFITTLVELWMLTFTQIVPCLQAVFLPLDLEFAGVGGLMTSDQARDFWGALPTTTSSSRANASSENTAPLSATSIPASQVLDIRRIVLTAFRDTVILPRFEQLKHIFSRLSLESINLLPRAHSHSNAAPPPFAASEQSLSSSPADRPGTGMSNSGALAQLDPSTASYSSQATTLMSGDGRDGSAGTRSRAISNVSFGSAGSRGTGSGSDRAGPSGTIAFPSFAPIYRGDSASAISPVGVSAAAGSTSHGSQGLAPAPSFQSTRTGRMPARGQSNSNTSQASAPGGGANQGNLALQAQAAQADYSTRLTETVGRMLQCMSVLASVSIGDAGAALSLLFSSSSLYSDGAAGGLRGEGETQTQTQGIEMDGGRKMEQLCELLKLNWLGRGRMGRNRRGLVGGRVPALGVGVGVGSVAEVRG
jgi:hypothetical protein